MVTRERWDASCRLISTKYPTVSAYDRICDTPSFSALLELESLTNPRMREEIGDYRKVRREDAISGPGSTPVMASFAYAQPSRFCDGTFGVYYAGRDEATAIAESRYHTERFLRATSEPSIDVDKRVYTAVIDGSFDDLRKRRPASPLFTRSPDKYALAQAYARRLYEANVVDGILYGSVRRPGGQCVAAFRPRVVSEAKLVKYIQFRWDGSAIVGTFHLTDITP